jgi:hypothetical protein
MEEPAAAPPPPAPPVLEDAPELPVGLAEEPPVPPREGGELPPAPPSARVRVGERRRDDERIILERRIARKREGRDDASIGESEARNSVLFVGRGPRSGMIWAWG